MKNQLVHNRMFTAQSMTASQKIIIFTKQGPEFMMQKNKVRPLTAKKPEAIVRKISHFVCNSQLSLIQRIKTLNYKKKTKFAIKRSGLAKFQFQKVLKRCIKQNEGQLQKIMLKRMKKQNN